MKRFIIPLLLSCLALCACEDHLVVLFDDYYVCIKDESGSSFSTASTSVDNVVTNYYVYLVAPTLNSDITVKYSVTPGDGLQEGVDYKLQNNNCSVTLARGVTRMPIRIIYLKHPVDESKNNTLTITLEECSDKSINLGYPGPASNFKSHVITKVNI